MHGWLEEIIYCICSSLVDQLLSILQIQNIDSHTRTHTKKKINSQN